jgi:putative membrane protein
MSATEKNPDPPAKAGDEADASRSPGGIQAHLAWLRTRMALETTLAGWVRTASALIAFGFAIVQFFENYNATQGPTSNHLARYLGLVLIGIGSLATAIAVWEYRKVMKYLEGEAFRGIAGVPGMRRVYPAVVVAILLCLIGLLAFFTILVGVEFPWPAKPQPSL